MKIRNDGLQELRSASWRVVVRPSGIAAAQNHDGARAIARDGTAYRIRGRVHALLIRREARYSDWRL